jgi:hypothetical protein
MTSTPNYIDYTMVAIRSMAECTPAAADNPHKVIVFLDGAGTADTERLLCLAAPELQIYPVDLQNPMWNGIMQQLEKIKERGFGARHRIVSLRLLFPNIWQSENLAVLGIPEMREFLFLDSDLLIMKDLNPLYEECLCENQPIIGANLWFITDDNLGCTAPLFCGGVGRVSTRHLRQRPNGSISARTSGGVVFWKISKVLEIYRQKGLGNFLIHHKCGSEEEVIFDSFLSRLGDDVYFFSYVFNARPDYRKAARDLFAEYRKAKIDLEDPFASCGEPGHFFARMLRNTRDRNCSDMLGKKAIQALKSLAKDDVAVWHWDGCKHKPADPKCLTEPGSPEEIWQRYFLEISEITSAEK